MSKVYNLKTVQVIPSTIEKVWAFFSNPRNLEVITGNDMDFKIISRHHGETIFPGQVIEYYLRPLLGIKVYWMTEITHVDHHKFFVDEQRFGPYSFWHHQHQFKEVDGGVEMTDIVHYKLPFWIFGDIAHSLFVKNKLRNIFDYRYKKIGEIFAP